MQAAGSRLSQIFVRVSTSYDTLTFRAARERGFLSSRD